MAIVGRSILDFGHLLPFQIEEAGPALDLEARLIGAGIGLHYELHSDASALSVTTYNGDIHTISMNPTDKVHVWYHELLHLKHLRLDEAAFIGARSGTPTWIVNEIGYIANNLSHAFVIREELEAYPDASPVRQEYYREFSACSLSYPAPPDFPTRNAWLAASQFLACQNIFLPDTACVEALRDACRVLELNIETLELDRNSLHGEDRLFAMLEEATHYPLHCHARVLRFSGDNVVTVSL